MLGSSQQPLKEIIQSPGHVSIVMPYGFVRIIPVTDQVPLDPAVRQWNGDSRGRWEGDTLVVETANFKETVNNAVPAHGGPFGGSAHVHYYPGTGETLRLTERFRRIDADTLEYRYTVEDPNVFVRPWSADQLLHARPLGGGGQPGPAVRVRLSRAQLRDDQRHPRRPRRPGSGRSTRRCARRPSAGASWRRSGGSCWPGRKRTPAAEAAESCREEDATSPAGRASGRNRMGIEQEGTAMRAVTAFRGRRRRHRASCGARERRRRRHTTRSRRSSTPPPRSSFAAPWSGWSG